MKAFFYMLFLYHRSLCNPGWLHILYHNYLVYEDNKVSINILNADQTYYFAIDSFNEAGVTIGKEIKTIQ